MGTGANVETQRQDYDRLSAHCIGLWGPSREACQNIGERPQR